jgi:hypothetical protein
MTAFRDTRAIVSVRERASAAFLVTPPSVDRRRVAAARPELDLDRWPSFASGAGLPQQR